MKRLALIPLLLLGSSLGAYANPIPWATLAWNASVSPNITNYTVAWGTNSGDYFASINTGVNVQAGVTNFTRGIPYFFAVKCTDNNGLDSPWSNEITYAWQLPPNAPPTNFHIVTNTP